MDIYIRCRRKEHSCLEELAAGVPDRVREIAAVALEAARIAQDVPVKYCCHKGGVENYGNQPILEADWEYEIPPLPAPVATLSTGLDGACMFMSREGGEGRGGEGGLFCSPSSEKFGAATSRTGAAAPGESRPARGGAERRGSLLKSVFKKCGSAVRARKKGETAAENALMRVFS